MAVERSQDDDTIEHIFRAWDEALGARDLDASMALYHEDATLESPLVRHLLGTEKGVIEGRENLRSFVAKVFAQEPPERQRFRIGFLSDGSALPGSTRDAARMASRWTSSRSWRSGMG